MRSKNLERQAAEITRLIAACRVCIGSAKKLKQRYEHKLKKYQGTERMYAEVVERNDELVAEMSKLQYQMRSFREAAITMHSCSACFHGIGWGDDMAPHYEIPHSNGIWRRAIYIHSNHKCLHDIRAAVIYAELKRLQILDPRDFKPEDK